MTDPLDQSKLKKIQEFYEIICKNGGYGIIEIEIKAEKVKFIGFTVKTKTEVAQKT